MTIKASNNVVRVDVAIIGGGIAGLWLLDRLRKKGYGALLIESERLGTGQTICSQGIIHGGAKYSLRGSVGESAKMVATMPALCGRHNAGAVAALLARRGRDRSTRRFAGRIPVFAGDSLALLAVGGVLRQQAVAQPNGAGRSRDERLPAGVAPCRVPRYGVSIGRADRGCRHGSGDVGRPPPGRHRAHGTPSCSAMAPPCRREMERSPCAIRSDRR